MFAILVSLSGCAEPGRLKAQQDAADANAKYYAMRDEYRKYHDNVYLPYIAKHPERAHELDYMKRQEYDVNVNGHDHHVIVNPDSLE